MNINVTLIGQMITFAILVWVTMSYIWPPIIKALDERQATIAQGLKDAQERARLLKEGESEAADIVDHAKTEALNTIKKAEARAAKLIEEAKDQAQEQAQRLLDRARADVEIEKKALREVMVKEIGKMVVSCSGKLLEKEIDAAANATFLEKVVAEIRDVS